jgi:two-component system sensor histidine kinase KdpD
MTAERPDPDLLLAQVRAQEAKQARGKLKIFFGAAPGVGKTYSMLEAGRKQAKEGVDVWVGYIEPHSRPETQALVLGLDVLPRRQIAYRGTNLLEFDLEGALAQRPQLILVDELAHTNAAGVTHTKRWQDVLRLLEAGLNVYTTLNVQHLESLNDIVSQITGVVVRETVPDSVFEQADEVELVDLAPDDLLERLREGKVYIPHEAERAMDHFFSKGNLIALRELALRRTAERVGTQMEVYREENKVLGTWPARERLLVCIGPSPFATRLIRATRRMAVSLKSPWVAVHVDTPSDGALSEEGRQRLAEASHLVEQLGGELVTLSGPNLADEVLHYARSRNVTRIVVGKPKQPRWKEWLRGSLVYELTRKSGDIDVYVISGDRLPPTGQAGPRSAARSPIDLLWALGVVALCTAASATVARYLTPVNLVMIYLLGVVVVSLRFGRRAAILAAVLSVATFDFFVVPPRWTFAVGESEYLITFAVMLLTGLVISTLVARVRFQVDSARRHERRTAALFAISRELAATQSRDQIARTAVEHVTAAVDARAVILLPDPQRKLVPLGSDVGGFLPSEHDEAVAKWVLEHGEVAGRGTKTLPGAEAVYLPLAASHGTVGVLGVVTTDERAADPEQLRLLEALAALAGLALERAALTAEAERIRLDMETERLRSSLLSAVSHDLRTPLSVITGAASTLLDGDRPPTASTVQELVTAILNEAERLNRLVGNLLDMTRLEAGALQVHKQWQPIEEVLGAVLNRLSRLLADHPVATHLPPDLPFAPFDDLLIQQVLINLLENVVRHTPPGTSIDLSACVQDHALQVEVADRGPGLPAGDPQRLFEKFARGADADARRGAGLGLAICRGIIALHGGQIHAENRPAGGAVFRFSLPLEGSPPASPLPEPVS